MMARRVDQAESWLVVDCEKSLSSLMCESLRDNEIDLALPASLVVMAFKYVSASVFCAMRLTKRDQAPVLRFEFNFMDSGNALVVHDVPVEILRSELVWMEPVLVEPDCRLVLSHPLKKLAQYIDRLKQMGIAEVAIDIHNRDSFFDIRLSGASDSLKTSFLITQQSRASTPSDDEPSVTQLALTIKGLSFILAKVSPMADSARCMVMASDSRYLSTWLQLQNQLGGIASVSPAIIVD